MKRPHLPTAIVCRGCSADNLFGAVLCEKCGNLLVADEPPPHGEPRTQSDHATLDEPEPPRFIIVGLNGADIPREAELSIPIPLSKLLASEPIRVGRRVSRAPDFPPEMDFGFLFYYHDPARGYPISRKAATLVARRGAITIRRTGSSSISVKRSGQRLNCPIEQGTAVEIRDGDTLIFGEPNRNIRALVVIPSEVQAAL